MNKIKKSFTLILFVFITLIFGGCASVDYSRTIQASGRVTDRLVIAISDEALSNANISAEDLFYNIQLDLKLFYLKPIDDFKQVCSDSQLLSTQEKLEIMEGITTEITQVGNEIICEVQFSNIRVFNLYYAPSTENTTKVVNGTFLNRYVQTSSNAFAILKNEQLAGLISKYRQIFNNTYDLENLKLSQTYASPNTSIYSNANQTKVAQGIKSHVWEINATNLDFNLEFYTIGPRTVSWYILALLLSIAVAVVLWTVFKIKNKKNNYF